MRFCVNLLLAGAALQLAAAGCQAMKMLTPAEPEPEENRPVCEAATEWSARAVLFLPKGDRLIWGGGNPLGPGELCFCAPLTLKSDLVRKDHRLAIWSLAASPDGSRLATGGGFGEVKVYEAASGKLLSELDAGGEYTDAVAFSPDGSLLANSAGKALNLWDVKTMRKAADVPGATFSTRSLAFSPDGRLLAFGAGDGIHFWDVAERREAFRLPDEEIGSSQLLFTPDGKQVVFGADDIKKDWSLIHVWDVGQKKEIRVLKGHERFIDGVQRAVIALTFDREGKYLVSGGGDETVRIWDFAGGKELACLRGNKGMIRGVAVSAGNKYLAACSDRLVRVWDLERILKAVANRH